MAKQDISIIILAAGSSTRLGSPKQLLKHQNGKTIITNACDLAISTEIDQIICVIPKSTPLIYNEIKGKATTILYNDPGAPMSSTLKIGLYHATKVLHSDAVLFMVCDQPYLNEAIVKNILKADIHKQSLIACQYENGKMGTPALFGSDYFEELLTIEGDQGAGVVLKKYADKVHLIEFLRGGFDLDTPEDVKKYYSNN